MLSSGEIEGERSESGRWRIPQGVVHELLKERRELFRELSEINSPALGLDTGTESTDTALYGPESVRELFDRVEALSRELGRSEARLELTERAESSVREERDRLRDELEAEREERRRLSERLERLRESGEASRSNVSEASKPPESPERGSEVAGEGSGAPAPQGGAQRPPEAGEAPRPGFLRGLAARIFGG
jgi:regulator of protease activity HflC (stomatin/prohibitin superfamily)